MKTKIRKFIINNPIKGDILCRCKSFSDKLKFEKHLTKRNICYLIFDELTLESHERSFLVEIILHQREHDPYKKDWAAREIIE